jgi:D-3-phosphoglycerate dehydrogenase
MEEVLLLQDLGVDREVVERRFSEILPSCTLIWNSESECPASLGSLEYLVTATVPVPSQVMADSSLKLVSIAGSDCDHVDLSAARENGIAVANAPGYSARSVAELSVLLAMSLLRKLKTADYLVREVRWEEYQPGSELGGKSVGVIGTGRNGIAAARLFACFGCDLWGYSRTEREGFTSLGGRYVDLDILLESSDVVSLYLPLNAETGNFIDYAELGKMKQSAILINTARGGLVNQKALARALENGSISGAGLDAYSVEPPPLGQRILYSPHTLLTPRIGCETGEALLRRVETALKNVAAFREGRLLNRIDV